MPAALALICLFFFNLAKDLSICATNLLLHFSSLLKKNLSVRSFCLSVCMCVQDTCVRVWLHMRHGMLVSKSEDTFQESILSSTVGSGD